MEASLPAPPAAPNPSIYIYMYIYSQRQSSRGCRGVLPLGVLEGLQGSVAARPPRPNPSYRPSVQGYRGTSLIRKRNPLGPYRRPMSRVLEGLQGSVAARPPRRAKP